VKENPYTELKKSNGNKKKEDFVFNLYIEMFLNEVLLKAEKGKLLEQIDDAIDHKNHELFIQLSSQYKELNKRFGL
jgi:uncharacterized protein YpiB (UPF0302 family)